MSEKTQRRLAAVWFADLVGYTQLSAEDEDAALELVDDLQAASREVVEGHDGRIVKFVGDGVLAEFASVREGTLAALSLRDALDRRLDERGSSGPVRVGVHVGEVTTTPDGDVLGDGVNVAARLQGAAGPGQVVVSEDVVRYLHRRPEFAFEDLGQRMLKGLAEPLRLYAARRAEERPRRGAKTASAGGPGHGDDSRTPSTASQAPARSIAVLRFADMSPDRDQEYFCDGISEEIINSLTRIKGLRVASRTSTFGLRRSDTDVRTIGARLGVSKLLEGSVRKAEDRLRITVQLLDVAADGYLWSERYDRNLEDVFAIQEDIAQRVVRELEMKLTPEESLTLRQSPTRHPTAYDFYLRGLQLFYRGTLRDHESAREMFSRAVEIDPSFTRAYAGLADTTAYLYKHFKHDPALLVEADRASAKAIELAPDLAEAHASRGVVLWLRGRNEDADREFETAIELDPRLFDAYYLFAMACYTRGELDRAGRLFEQASAVRPEDYQALLIQGAVYRGLGRQREAEQAYHAGLEVARRHLEMNPDDARAWYLGAGALVALGKLGEGLEWAQKALAVDSENPLLLYNLAGIYGAAGRIDEGIDFMERAVGLGFGHKQGLENDPDLAPLRGHPRFEALIHRLGWASGRTASPK